MAFRLSTGTRQALLGSADFRTKFTLSAINIYTGTQPPSPDDAVSGTLLATITVDGTGTGLNFDAPVDGAISKAAAETWAGDAVATGTAGWFRLYILIEAPDGSSLTLARVDGRIATSGGELNMSSTAITAGATQTITGFTVVLPAS